MNYLKEYISFNEKGNIKLVIPTIKDILIELLDGGFEYELIVNNHSKDWYKLIDQDIKWITLRIKNKKLFSLLDVEEYILRLVDFLDKYKIYPMYGHPRGDTIISKEDPNCDCWSNKIKNPSSYTEHGDCYTYEVIFIKSDDLSESIRLKGDDYIVEYLEDIFLEIAKPDDPINDREFNVVITEVHNKSFNSTYFNAIKLYLDNYIQSYRYKSTNYSNKKLEGEISKIYEVSIYLESTHEENYDQKSEFKYNEVIETISRCIDYMSSEGFHHIIEPTWERSPGIVYNIENIYPDIENKELKSIGLRFYK